MLEAVPEEWNAYAEQTEGMDDFIAMINRDVDVNEQSNDLDTPEWVSVGSLANKCLAYVVRLLDSIGSHVPIAVRNAIAHYFLREGLPGGQDDSHFENLSDIELPLPGLRPERIRKLTREVVNLEASAKAPAIT